MGKAREMIQELMELAKAQPILVGGVGTVLTSASLYVLRSIPSQLFRAVRGSLVSTIDVNSRHDFYGHIDHYLWQHRIKWAFRAYEPGDNGNEEDPDSPGVYLNPGYGKGYGFWKGVFFSFNKSKEEKGYELIKAQHIKLYTRDVNKVHSFIEEASKFQRGDPRQRVYVSAGYYWKRVADKKIRPLSTVFINGNTLNTVVETITQFQNSEDLYIRRGIPYKLCVMLYGPPGTGKTSLIHALASHFKLDINYITGLGSLGNLLGSRSNRPSIIVAEDIDTLSNLKRDDDEDDDIPAPISLGGLTAMTGHLRKASLTPHTKEKEDSMRVLHDMLNSLDGFTTSHGMVVFLTSNHPEKLDHALLRPGRIDLGLEIGPLDFESAGRMFTAFYGVENYFLWEIIKPRYTPVIGAKLQEIFMSSTPDQAVGRVLALTTQREAA